MILIPFSSTNIAKFPRFYESSEFEQKTFGRLERLPASWPLQRFGHELRDVIKRSYS
jgi:hypothetical protein